MRSAWLFSVVAATLLIGQAVEAAGVISATPNPAAASAAKANVTTSDASQSITARPDRDRYYWHDGQWWYYTPQNTWLRWNGLAWAPYTRTLRGPSPLPYPEGIPRSDQFEAIAPPASTLSGMVAPSYRYDINTRRAGL